MKDYLLFDLDGTLTDPKIGITTCAQHALRSFGIEVENLDELEPFIGPPLKTSFMEFYHLTEEQANEAIRVYRERYATQGQYENVIYPGIARMLRHLKQKGLHLAVASSKTTNFVESILDHFGIRKYFDVVVGSELDGTRSTKTEVMQEALSQLFKNIPVNKERVYMIGDRNFDIVGAKELKVESVGVTYGYGGMEELREAHADYIVRSVRELEEFLLRGFSDEEIQETVSSKVMGVFLPILLFLIVRSIVQNAGGMLFQKDGQLADNLQILIAGMGFLAGGAAMFPMAQKQIRQTEKKERLHRLLIYPPLYYVIAVVMTIGFVFGITILLNLCGLVGMSGEYKQVSENQVAGNIFLRLIVFGCISPVAEELVFRGIVFNRFKEFPKLRIKYVLLLQALLFGIYHMNIVQGIYGFLMALLIAYGYEYFGEFKVPVLMHVIANVLAVLLAAVSVPWIFKGWIACILCMLVGGLSLHYLKKHRA